MSRQTCDVATCGEFAVSFDDAEGFWCEKHAAADAAVTR